MPSTTKAPALSQIDDAARQIESALVSHMEKKSEGTLEEQLSHKDLSTINYHFNRLNDLHMNTYYATSESKEMTTNAKNEMNEKRVDLQDVMYERKHILEEIVGCRQFRSVYQDVELIPLEEFKSQAGPEYQVDPENTHQLMINRLKYELVVRTALKEQKEELELEKTKLIKENRKLQKKVDQFDKLLDDFVLSAAPVEEALQKEASEAERDKANAMDVTNSMNVSHDANSTVETMDTTL